MRTADNASKCSAAAKACRAETSITGASGAASCRRPRRRRPHVRRPPRRGGGRYGPRPHSPQRASCPQRRFHAHRSAACRAGPAGQRWRRVPPVCAEGGTDGTATIIFILNMRFFADDNHHQIFSNFIFMKPVSLSPITNTFPADTSQAQKKRCPPGNLTRMMEPLL